MPDEVRDYALTAGDDRLVAHRADCPDARAAAARGDLVVTLLDCKRPLPNVFARHHCLPERSPKQVT